MFITATGRAGVESRASSRFGQVCSGLMPTPNVHESPSARIRSVPGGFSNAYSRSRIPCELIETCEPWWSPTKPGRNRLPRSRSST